MTYYEEGRTARIIGKQKSVCPYAPEFVLARRNWIDGWGDSDTMIRALEPYQESKT